MAEAFITSCFSSNQGYFLSARRSDDETDMFGLELGSSNLVTNSVGDAVSCSLVSTGVVIPRLEWKLWIGTVYRASGWQSVPLA